MGRLVAKRNRVTIRDVAAAAGVSVATVSRVVNGHTGVDPDLVTKVTEAVRDHGYVPNPTGRALRRQVANLWNVIVPDLNVFYTQVVAAIESVAMDNGIAVLLSNTQEQLEREQHYVRTAAAQQVAGVVIAVASRDDSDLSPLVETHTPTVLIDRQLAGFAADSVTLDNVLAGRLAAEHLLEQGFRAPACVSGPEAVSTAQERLESFRATLAEHGVQLPETRVARAQLSPESARAATAAMLQSDDPPDSMYAVTASLTLGAYHALKANPGHVGLVGQDDDLWASLVQPSVSVIRQPTVELGQAAAGQLLRRIAGDKTPAKAMVMAPRLVVRESSKRH
jgi:DNA-binding LacI/PurR family transcriptional regulator